MRILFFGTYDTSTHPRVAVLAEGLRAHFDDVTECNAPLGVSTQERVSIVSSAAKLAGLALRILSSWMRLLRMAAGMPRPDVVIVGYLGHFDVLLARLRFPGALIVLDYLISGADTAADRRVGSAFVHRLLRGLDRVALVAADVVIVDTEANRTRLPLAKQARSVVVPVGASESWFHEPVAYEGRRLGVVFFGLFTPLQGTVTIGEALAELSDEPIDVTMIGNGQDYAASRDAAASNPNVEWIDWIEGEDLADVVSQHEVCLGIVGTTAKAKRVVPTKAYQGAAAGCLVVTSDTKPQREMLGDAAIYVTPGDGTGLAATLRGLAADPDVLELRQRSHRIAVDRFAAPKVVAPLVDHLRASG